jgi:hypothetical protein
MHRRNQDKKGGGDSMGLAGRFSFEESFQGIRPLNHFKSHKRHPALFPARLLQRFYKLSFYQGLWLVFRTDYPDFSPISLEMPLLMC